ncbi:tripartite tricarboxylate transporter TctB family protein [Pseudolabrys sp. FHR47]|uniref:tripartite tricarboxylate transporter TctB family protein n=1 Tax=Pseudolabrys sp. FHR47 TaxID=2562284 RepID=UPI0010BF45EC|nr:tripartite tricarboxylate transporter TctB family protein [Pseudolabrys sp. FHR47]
MQQRPLARADLITGLVLTALGAATAVESYRMPRLEERSIDPWTAPGIVPGMLGLIILVLGAALALRSVAAGALTAKAAPDTDPVETRAARFRFVLCLALCLVYAVVLVGHAPFWLATGTFVFTFIAAFEWRASDDSRARSIKLAIAAVIAIATAVIVPFVFETLFLVRLP